MSTFTPNFNIEVPTPATKAKELGAELLAFGMSVDSALKTFTYNGADPNLVLSRVAALEAWRTSAAAKISALEASTAVQASATAITQRAGFTVVQQFVQKDARGNIKIDFQVNGSLTSGAIVADLAAAFRPVVVWIQPCTPIPVGTSAGNIRVDSSNGSLTYYGPGASTAHVCIEVR